MHWSTPEVLSFIPVNGNFYEITFLWPLENLEHWMSRGGLGAYGVVLCLVFGWVGIVENNIHDVLDASVLVLGSRKPARKTANLGSLQSF